MKNRSTLLGRSLRSAFAQVFEFVYPRHCEVCGKHTGLKTHRLEFMCNKCLDSIPLAPGPHEIMNKLVSSFPEDELAISNACCLFSVSAGTDYMEIIYSLKYRGIKKIGRELGRLLGRRLDDEGMTAYDYILPVPIHHARTRERGYNQAEFIARGISDRIGIPVGMKFVKRKKYTTTQTALNSEQRRKNVSMAFAAGKLGPELFDSKILLVDDVLTSGSTLNACANTLLEAGARQVDVAALGLAEK